MLPVLAAIVKAGLPILAGAVASSGKDLIEKKLGIDLTSALGSEEGQYKLKQLEYEHEEFLINSAQTTDARELDYFKAEVEDRKDARSREVEVARTSGAPYWFPSTVTLLTFVIVCGCGWLFATTKEENTKYVLVSVITMVLQYYYGTTKASSSKDSIIAGMVDKTVGGQK
jgi:hypothetical protein